MPLPTIGDSVPPVATASPVPKVVEGSLSVNVMVAVWPLRRAVVELVMVTVGDTVSMASDGARAPAMLGLPAASVNMAAATRTVPVADGLGVGVKVIV